MAGPASISVRTDLRPGDIGYIIWMHGVLYAREQGWDSTFESYVGEPLSQFAKKRSQRERIWIAEQSGKIVGTIAIVEALKETAQLRWLLVTPDMRGNGLGRSLMQSAIQFSREQSFSSIFLWTVSALQSAAKLYNSFNFMLTERITHQIWGSTVTEERYDLNLINL